MMSPMTADFERAAAEKYGAYASFVTESSPARIDYHGENPADEVARLLDRHVSPGTRFLDVGCGAGGTLCRLGPRVAEAWGVDQADDLLAVARERLRQAGLTRVRLVHANVATADFAELPDAHFQLALSERGPHLNERLVGKLADGAVVVQELVGSMEGYPLKEIFGRRPYLPYEFGGPDPLVARYAELGLFPISVKQYYYDQLFRDADHLALHLSRGAALSNWRLPGRPYDPARDRPALDLYARYYATADGVRVLGHRVVLALRKTTVTYYPADAG